MNGGDDMYEAQGSVAFFAAHVTERTHGGLSPLSHSASTSRVCSWHYCTITSVEATVLDILKKMIAKSC